MGWRIYHPSEIMDIEYDEIIVATSKIFYPAIKEQIVSEFGISERRIHTFTWLLTAMRTGYQAEGRVQKNSGNPIVYDCFPFYNELDILELRMELLNPVVDYFVLVELDKTQRWEDKPLYFDRNRDRFDQFKSKIIYIRPTEIPERPQNTYMNWALENYQRNSILDGLRGRASSEDLILVSDVDEIPNPERITELKNHPWLVDCDVFSFEQKFFYYYLDFCHKTKWNGTFVTKYKNLGMPQEWRNICGALPELPDGGWHLSYFGGVERIGLKVNSTVESAEFKVSADDIKTRISAGKDIYGRVGAEFELEHIDVTRLDIPDVSRIRKKYPHFFYKG